MYLYECKDLPQKSKNSRAFLFYQEIGSVSSCRAGIFIVNEINISNQSYDALSKRIYWEKWKNFEFERLLTLEKDVYPQNIYMPVVNVME